MNKKVLLSASVAIAAYALGITGFTLAVSTHIMIMQGLLLGIAFSSIRLFVPVCTLMTNAMLVASFGMMALGCILKLALSLPRTRALPH